MVKKAEDYKWSSCSIYISKAKKANWLYKDFVLSQFSNKLEDSIKAFYRYVSLEDEAKITGFFEKKKWPVFLGSEDFIRRIKEKFLPEKINDEMPQSRELTPGLDLIQKTVMDHYGIEKKDLLFSRRGVRNEPRNVAIFLTRQLRGDRLGQIGLNFRMDKYSSVSTVIARMKQEMIRGRKLRDRVEIISNKITKSQEQT